MRVSNGSRRSTPEPDRSQRVRFSSVSPSAPLFTFSVLEWTPANSLLAHLYPKRATSLQRLDNNASMASTEEERRDPRDRVVFETTSGTWTCFRQISCCGDVLVLEDASAIDVGPPRRHEYTWQQGPGRLPSVENSNTSFGASGGWRQTLASTTQSVSEVEAEAAAQGTLISRPTHHRREIPLQDIHSIRRHCFKRPVPLTFNSSGHLGAGTPEDARGSKSKGSHSGSAVEDMESLEWRYELWGPVGVIFMLRGGARLFLVFASGQHAEQMEELLISFASGRGLQRRQRQSASAAAPPPPASLSFASPTTASSALPSPSVAASSSTQAPANLLASIASAAGYKVESPVTPGQPGSPAVSYASLRLGSCEASFRGAPSSSSFLPSHSLVTPEVSARPSSSFGVLPVAPSTSVVSVGSPLLPPAAQSSASGTGLAATASPIGLLSNASTSVASVRANGSQPLRVPGTGYLYCRPWGEAVRHRRYYLRPAAASPLSGLVRMSRHRLPAWQKIRQTLGQEPRCVSMDLKLTYLTPSSTHENVFRVESVVDTYAQYRDVVPLGGAVATAGPGNESPSMMAARRREMELCRSRPVVFEALAKTGEERAEWLGWLQARGATVLRPEATDSPHMVATAKGSGLSSRSRKPVTEEFQPLGHQMLPSSLSGPTGAKEAARANSVDRWVSNCGIPSSSADLSPSADPLGGARQPQLPLRESDSERGSLGVSLRSKWPTNSPMRYPQPQPHPIRLSVASKQSTASSSFSPDPVGTGEALRKTESGSGSDARHRRSADFDEASIVVEDGECDARVKLERLLRLQQEEQQQQKQQAQHEDAVLSGGSAPTSPNTSQAAGPAVLDHTVRPSRLGVTSPASKHAAVLSDSSLTHEGKPTTTTLSAGSAVLTAAGGATVLSPPAEDGAMTDLTLTGTGPTVVGAPRTPMYLEDTSSGDVTPRFPTPSLTNTAAATSPHSKTSSLRSPSAMGLREVDGDAVRGRRLVPGTLWSTPRSPHYTLTEKDDHLLFDSSGKASRKGDAAAVNGRPASHVAQLVDGKDETPLPRIFPSKKGHAELQRSSTDSQLLRSRPDTSVYSSEARAATGSTPLRTLNTVYVTPAFASSSSSATALFDVEGATATTAHSRSETVAPTVEEVTEEQMKAAFAPTPHERGGAAVQRDSSASASPSPDAPTGAVPLHALHADDYARAADSQTSPMTRRLFSQSVRDDEAAHTSENVNAALNEKHGAAGPLKSVLSLSSNGSFPAAKSKKVAVVEENGSGEWSGFPTEAEAYGSNSYLPASERRLDPRLSQFFTPTRKDVESSGEHIMSSSSVDTRVVHSSLSGHKLGPRAGKDSSPRMSAGRPSLRDSPLPPALPPRAGSLSWLSPHGTPVDSGSRGRAGVVPTGDAGDGAQSPKLPSASSRATYRDSEHVGSPLVLQSREMIEQRKRAFRDSLFVNQE